ncbi:crosslink repair DNA glycosylase YcaQ family protein [Williamsia sp.]|uniref:winged helix-turn-helix domain-containing protein n=1 Tax=Williamsia sp. TaxID=1872085 RepID=UPI001A2E7024|nr:crosslink repair DNA glycosylase YcaQ family protein [Williamsia sp.]MBJ7290093.1 YcaQ family DNA glycosylase [Williamsia sp.]
MARIGDRLTIERARRIVLAAQGFTDPLPSGPVTRRHLQRVLSRTRFLQMDSVSIAVRAHYMPLFSRLGPYDRDLLDRAAGESTARAPRLLAEYWAHEAALIPVQDWPLFGWRMADYRFGRYGSAVDEPAERSALRVEIATAIADLGPSTGGELEEYLGRRREGPRRGTWWDRSEVKHVCEVMLAAGELSAIRRGGFNRHYDLAANIVGPEIAATVIDRDVAIRTLVGKAIGALGVATETDLRDYYRLPVADTRSAVADLVDSGDLVPVEVDGWDRPAFLDPGARVPRRVERSALLAPFDPLVFFRPRLQRLFDTHYRIEIYVPEHKRVHGYYVFPYLLDETISARVDLKAERADGVLAVLGAFAEDGVDRGHVARSLAADLVSMATWLGLDGVRVGTRGDLAPGLRAALGGSG